MGFMYWKRKIDYQEYDCSMARSCKNFEKAGQSGCIDQGSITVTPVKLAVATARAFMTKTDGYRADMCLMAASLAFQFPVILGVDEEGNLRIKEDFAKTFRDFSKTSRIGELAQGINYIAAKEALGCISVMDYEAYLKDIGKAPKGRRPDYVVGFPDETIGILESKGTLRNPTDSLKAGLKQCDGKSKEIGAGCSYSMVTGFATTGQKKKTVIHYADPKDQGKKIPYERSRGLLLGEYGKWFCIAGRYEEALELKRDQRIFRGRIGLDGEKKLLGNREGIPIGKFRFFLNDGTRARVTYGISENVLLFLEGKTAYVGKEKEYLGPNTDREPDNDWYNSKYEPDRIQEWYPDGTWLEIITE